MKGDNLCKHTEVVACHIQATGRGSELKRRWLSMRLETMQGLAYHNKEFSMLNMLGSH